MKKRVVVLVLAAVLVFGCAIGGTLAWLQDKTDTVTNVFTYGNVDIDLTENEGTVNAEGNREFKMIPGSTIDKDPKITVDTDSEYAYIFVEITKSENYSDFLEEYAIADGWTALAGADGVYYREYNSESGNEFYVLKNNQVKVSDDVTKGDIEGIGTDYPTLSFTAYAVQKENVETVAAAWAIAKPAQQGN